MKKIWFCVFLLLCTYALHAQVLSQNSLQKLQDSVFEVVTKKVTEDNARYERELPWERLPYSVRTDNYNPVGTAFLMSDGYFYTAAHVLQFTEKLLQDDFYIRDSNGNVWSIDSVIAFATDRDVAVFTAKAFSFKTAAGLDFNTEAEINSTVFAVGNAQGEGIVIRNGMFTSQTPEEQNGEWKWLRFSAAASPGNSGGPLIDQDGRVLGIITMKNSTENLNYALPASELAAVPRGEGRVKMSAFYSLPNLPTERHFFHFDFSVPLPAPFAQVRTDCFEKLQALTKDVVAEFSSAYTFSGEKSFTKADVANPLNYNSFGLPMPCIMYLDEHTKWTYGSPSFKKSALDNNGTVYYGNFGEVSVAYIEKPENVPLQALITQPQRVMDYILKADGIVRPMGQDTVKVLTLGKPSSAQKHVDIFSRTWLVHFYDIPWAEASVITYTLPLPGGTLVLYKIDHATSIYDGWNFDLAYLTDFVMPSYYASIKQWNEYVALPAQVYQRHGFIRNGQFIADSGHVAISFGDIKINLNAKTLHSIGDDDIFYVNYTYLPHEKLGLRQAVSGVGLLTNVRTKDYHAFDFAHVRPLPQGADKAAKETWSKMYQRQDPFNGEPLIENNTAHIFYVANAKNNTFDLITLSLSPAVSGAALTSYLAEVKAALGIK